MWKWTGKKSAKSEEEAKLWHGVDGRSSNEKQASAHSRLG